MINMTLMHQFAQPQPFPPQEMSPLGFTSPFANDVRGTFVTSMSSPGTVHALVCFVGLEALACVWLTEPGLYDGRVGPQLQQQHNMYRLGEPPLNLSYKRLSEELQWKTDSPVSVTARIFRPSPSTSQPHGGGQANQEEQQQQADHRQSLTGTEAMAPDNPSTMTLSSPVLHVGGADAFKADLAVYRATPTGVAAGNQFGGTMEQVWPDECL